MPKGRRWFVYKKIVLLIVGLLTCFVGYKAWEAWHVTTPPGFVRDGMGKMDVVVTRLPQNPIITDKIDDSLMLETKRYGYININGPSVIRVPSWVNNPLGKYYMYFAHHKGEYIRLAYAESIEGPWQVYRPGVLHVKDSLFTTQRATGDAITTLISMFARLKPTEFWALLRVGLDAGKAHEQRVDMGIGGSDELKPHVASPDVIVDDKRKEIRLYYHGLLEDRTQMTRLAISRDGICFIPQPDILSPPYLRIISYRDEYYGIAMPALLYRSPDGLSSFEVRAKPLAGPDTRHLAVLRKGNTLYVFWTRTGDAPERILCSTMDMTSTNWNDWRISEPVDVLLPAMPWEGVDLPIEPSLRGEMTTAARQLRDPAVFEEGNRTYMFYCCAGEQAIALAEIVFTAPPGGADTD
jgi:hypothetical protein